MAQAVRDLIVGVGGAFASDHFIYLWELIFMSDSMRFIRRLLVIAPVLGVVPAWADVTVKDAWVRGTVEGQTSTGAYMVIASDHDVTLTSAATPLADHAQVHEMQMHGDMMMMMPVERLAIPAGKPVALDERNYHLMLEGLHHAVRAGDSVPISLNFVGTKGDHFQVSVQAVARALSSHGASMDNMDGPMNHH
jgi:copper(I)-binding protein